MLVSQLELNDTFNTKWVTLHLTTINIFKSYGKWVGFIKYLMNIFFLNGEV